MKLNVTVTVSYKIPGIKNKTLLIFIYADLCTRSYK